MDAAILLLVLLFVVGGFLVIGLIAAWRLIYICGPNEVLVFSGFTRTVEGGRTVGYRTIKGGRAFRWPLLETVDRMDLTNMIIEVSVSNAYSRGGIPLNVQGVANVKIAGHEPVLDNAIERFLGFKREEIITVAKDTLEGNLRGVLSQLTPEQVNEDKIAFAEKLLEEAEHDLTRLGLVLDTLKIQNVSDDKGYLNSIGRAKSAELVTRSMIAEANSKAKAVIQDASNRERARISALESEMEIARAETERRIADAISRREALIAEEVGKVRALVADVEGQVKVQTARVEQVRRQLEADVIAPAQAAMERDLAEAKGNAAKIVEDGKATVQVLDQMIATWKQAGPSARDIFLMQKLQATLGQLVGTIEAVKVDKLTVLPPDAQVSARNLVTVVEELKGALGVDLPRVIEAAAQRPSNPQ